VNAPETVSEPRNSLPWVAAVRCRGDMVRRGSTVRVRQRASRNSLQAEDFVSARRVLFCDLVLACDRNVTHLRVADEVISRDAGLTSALPSSRNARPSFAVGESVGTADTSALVNSQSLCKTTTARHRRNVGLHSSSWFGGGGQVLCLAEILALIEPKIRRQVPMG
jgi:hypothetical protein